MSAATTIRWSPARGCVAAAVWMLVIASSAAAQTPPPPLTPQFLNENCIVSVLNRNVRANPDGTWILPNVPANFGPVRARATCVIDGRTISGESAPFTVPANGAVNIPEIILGSTTPIPTALTITASTTTLTTIGGTVQLNVNAHYPGGTTTDVTANPLVTYTVSNPAIATLSPSGLVQAVTSGTVLIQATLEGANGMVAIRVAASGNDADGDGIPDDAEIELGLNPNDPVDALEDFDRDGLPNRDEYLLGTDLRNPDSDGDQLSDGQEIARGTAPLVADTDGDGIRDGLEVQTSSNPLDPNSFNLAAALSDLTISPPAFTLTFNTIAGDASVQLQVRGALRDGTTIDLTSTQRGTNYLSSDLNVCSFSASPGRVFAGVSGGCTISATVGGRTANATGTVTTFAPTALSSLALGGPGYGVDVAGDFVYVAAGPAGLKVVDVGNRNAPLVAATLNLVGSAFDVRVAGTRAYVAAFDAGLHVVDVSNPSIPRLLGSVDTPGFARDVQVRGDLAYVADGNRGLQIIDIANPAAPRVVGSLLTQGLAEGVDVEGTLAAVAAGSAGIYIVDVSDPVAPALVGEVDTPGQALDLVVSNGFAYVADSTGSMRVVDFRNPAAPVLGGTTPLALGGVVSDVARADTFLFGADVFFVNGVPIVDVSDPDNLRPRAILTFPGDATGLGIAVDGSYVYLGTDTNQLFIGQFRIQQDLHGIAPTVSIAAPVNGETFVEGETIPVTVNAADDLAVVSVTLLSQGNAAGIDTTAPYLFTVTAPMTGAGSLELSARAVDLGNNTGVAPSVIVTIIPDPLTTLAGRAVTQASAPVPGATVTCGTSAATTSADGSFSIAGVRTVQPVIVCQVRGVVDGVILGGRSAAVQAVRGGLTSVGDIVVSPVPIVSSISPRNFDAARPPASLEIAGTNLTGSTFTFVPELSPAVITAGLATIDPTGTTAIVPITVSPTGHGRFSLVGTNAFGGGDATPTTGNSVYLINAQDDVDSDGDGFADGLELLLGSDPTLASSTPNVAARGDVQSQIVTVLNRLFPADLSTATRESQSPWVAVRNELFPPLLLQTTRESQSAWFGVKNALFPSGFTSTLEAQSSWFAVANTLLPPLTGTREFQSQWFSLLNQSFPLSLTTNVEPRSQWFSLLNDPTAKPAAPPVSSSAVPPAPALSLVVTAASEPLMEGQTIVLRAEAAGDEVTSVTFTVNGVVMGTSASAPHEMLFTIPAGVTSLTMGAAGSRLTGGPLSAASIVREVQPWRTITLTGRVTDASGNPQAGAQVEVLSEGVDAEFFELASPVTDVPELGGRTADRVTRLTTINIRNPGGLFGGDPFGTGLAPDYAGRLTGWITIGTPGLQTFALGASEAARLVVGDTTVVDLGVGTSEYREAQGSVDLPAGRMPFEITFVQGVGSGDLRLSHQPPVGTLRTVPPASLTPGRRTLTATADQTGRFTITDVPAALGSVQVRATAAGTQRTATSNLLTPTPRSDVDVGEIVIPDP